MIYKKTMRTLSYTFAQSTRLSLEQVYYQRQDKVQIIFCRLICPVLSLILGIAIQTKTVTHLFSKAVSSIGR